MKLTRKLILAKAKASDLQSVRKLNCWGCSLTDISIFCQVPNIEVLTLSVNSVASLSPLTGCLSLSELYLRRNMIPSLSELCHLRPLTRLRVLWLAENPCCGNDPSKYRLTVLRCLPRLQKLDNQVVTEGEIALALMEGEEVSTPPGSVQNQLSNNGLPEAETENDALNYNMEETNKIREELGMKPLSRDKFSSPSSPSIIERPTMRKTHTLDAVLLLLKDLDEEELHIVHTATQNRLQTYTLDSGDVQSFPAQKTADIQH
ncbi:cilia and flagella associated protein 410 [Nothobranchius furzeri]|uniref:Cilia- and flagella-associated protein 410 n=3 Tax=Nothobranchius TaxID=28779 RepID=A0A1A8V4R3_NOTFU|nr:cilia and flagella associated protein 410 [Nothobranchius furzeri]XP_015812929.1 cilia and flagella associated protein 410 [Nothobranchius furzeri]KAF7222982.1 transcript variant X1 [Nothobranchius furzeri]KAF7222983.1 transcript variant X3 [Nothobranchius furzeri]KAF7222984.1 transcript variant X2 [Nothobranchius furzeri]